MSDLILWAIMFVLVGVWFIPAYHEEWRQWRIWRGTETPGQEARRLAREERERQRVQHRKQQAALMEPVLEGVGKTLLVFVAIVVGIVLWPVMPALSGADAFLLLILLELHSQGAKS